MNTRIISDDAMNAVRAQSTLHFRTLINNTIMERVITPIQNDNNSIRYSHIKKEYNAHLLLLITDDAFTKVTLNDSFLLCKKNMPDTTTENDRIIDVIYTLESSGYVFIPN